MPTLRRVATDPLDLTDRTLDEAACVHSAPREQLQERANPLCWWFARLE